MAGKKTYAPKPTYIKPRSVAYQPPTKTFKLTFAEYTLIIRVDEDKKMHESAIVWHAGEHHAFDPFGMPHWQLEDYQQTFVDVMMGAYDAARTDRIAREA